MNLYDQISKDIMVAMKAKDKVRLEALRNIKKYFIEAKTAPGNNDELNDADAIKILAKLAKQGKDSATLYKEKGREEMANEELAQVEVIESYLPQALSEDEITNIIKNIISETGASSMKEMGKVMGIASKKMAGQADGKTISNIVKQLLG